MGYEGKVENDVRKVRFCVDVKSSDMLSHGGRELPKKPTEIRITRDSETILVSDKFGDVFRSGKHRFSFL